MIERFNYLFYFNFSISNVLVIDYLSYFDVLVSLRFSYNVNLLFYLLSFVLKESKML